jgi:hypothetical protein
MSKDTGGAAFPQPMTMDMEGNFHTPREKSELDQGITIRDYFAGQALVSRQYHPSENLNKELAAKWCYEIADAMLAERGKQ